MVDFGRAYYGVAFDPAEVAKLEAQSAALGNKVAQIGSKGTTSFGTALSKSARVARIGLLGMGAATVYALKQAGDFQQQLNVLQATSGATASQMKSLSAQALRLGADVKLPSTSAQDAAQALTELVKAGLSVKDAMAAARPVLQLSAAAQVDNATAANLAATALNSFHLPGQQAAHVADLLAGAANASAGTITDMGQAIQYAGAAMHGAGQSIDDTATAIALMSNAGLSGSVAGSSLAAAFRALQAPSKKAESTMKELGISLYDAKGQMLPMRGIINELGHKFEGLTQAQQNQKLATIFGSRAVQAARIVFLGGTEAYDKMSASVTKTGSAQKLAEAQTKGFTGTVQALVSQLQTAAISIGTDLLPAAGALVGGFTALVGVMEQNKTASEAFFTTLVVGATAVVLINAGLKAYEATMIAVDLVQKAVTRSNPFLLIGSAAAIALPAVLAFASQTADQTSHMTDALNDARDAVHGLTDAFEEQASTALDVQQAQHDVRQSAADYAKATQHVNELVKAGKKGTEEYGQALRDQNQAEINLQRAQLRRGDAQKANTQATKKAWGEIDKLRDSMKRAKDAAKLESKEMVNVAGKTSFFRANSEKARQTTETLANKMAAVARAADVQAKHLDSLNPHAAATARRIGAAADATSQFLIQMGRVAKSQKEFDFYVRTHYTSTGDLTTTGRGRSLPGHGQEETGTPGKPIPGSAGGNRLLAGQATWVGERHKPELYIPDTNGRMISDLQLERLSGGDGATVVNIEIDGERLHRLIDYHVEQRLSDVARLASAGPRRG